MNIEAVEEMIERRQKLQEVIYMMNATGTMTMHTPQGPVKIAVLKNEAKFIDMMLIDELEDMPISGILINLLY